MSYASPRPILADAASAVAAAPPVNAWGVREGRAGPGREPGAPAQLPADLPWRFGDNDSAAPGLRLLPAGGFAWSGPQGLPRTRGDHVLVWLTAGMSSLRLPRREGPAPALLFLPAGTAFALRPSPEAQGLALLIGRDLAARATTPLPSAVIEAAPDAAGAAALTTALSALAEEARRDDPHARRAQAAGLGALALQLTQVAAADAATPPAQDLLVRRFLALAARGIPPGRTPEELAAMLGCTAATLDEACRRRRGKPALDLFAEARIGRAVDLLAATDRPLAEIARSCGFGASAELSRAVLAATGCTPEALRPGRAR